MRSQDRDPRSTGDPSTCDPPASSDGLQDDARGSQVPSSTSAKGAGLGLALEGQPPGVSERWRVQAPRVRVTRPVRIDPSGLTGPTPGQARGPGWEATSTGLHVPTGTDRDLVEQRIIEQGVRLRHGVITGWAALRLHRAGYLDGLARDGVTRLPVQVAANGDRLRSCEGLDVRRVMVEEDDVVIRYGVRCATPERALFDAMRWAETLDDRVVIADMTFAAELTSLRRVRAYVRRLRHVHDRMLVLEALSWCDEGADSPQEVRLRLIWRRRFSWTSPLTNRTVLDPRGPQAGTSRPGQRRAGDGGGVRRRRPPLASPASHRRTPSRRLPASRSGDRDVRGEDLDAEDLVAERLRATYERVRDAERRWRLAPPGPSLDDRLDHRDFLRDL